MALNREQKRRMKNGEGVDDETVDDIVDARTDDTDVQDVDLTDDVDLDATPVDDDLDGSDEENDLADDAEDVKVAAGSNGAGSNGSGSGRSGGRSRRSGGGDSSGSGGGSRKGGTKTAAPVEKRTTAVVFVKEVRGELRKVAWPTRKETLNYSGVVAIALVFMTLLIFGLDWVFSEFVLRLFNVK
jgi:preprotein translocase subunit SecE